MIATYIAVALFFAGVVSLTFFHFAPTPVFETEVEQEQENENE